MSLEVAQHLSGKAGARLCPHIDSGGTARDVLGGGAWATRSHHINEQWPGYWRSLFADEGFRLFDPIRPLIRDGSSVRWWYRQNLLFFASQQEVSAHPRLGPEVPAGEEMEWVHISLIRKPRDLRATLRNLPGVPWAWSQVKPWLRPKPRYIPEPTN